MWAPAILCVVRRPVGTTGARVPHPPVWDYHGSAFVPVWLWWLELTSISWCWLSVTNVFLTFTQVVLSVVLSIVLHWLYIHLGFFVFVCLCAAVYGVIKNNNLVRLSSIVPFHIIYQVNLYWRNNSAHKYNYFETLFHTLAFHTNFSRIFHPCKLVPHFHVSHFPPVQSGAENSCLAFSTLAFWCRRFMSRIFHPCIFDRPVFSCLAFSVAPWKSLFHQNEYIR